MIQELLYTSAPKGLKPGSRGFSTVLSTQGMSAPLAAALEGLSGYRPLFAPTDAQHASNPVVHAHVTFSVGGRRVNVLSRIADFGLDYTQRTNKLAHHVVVDPENQSPAGPAWLLGRSELMRSTWDGEPRVVPLRQAAPMADVAPAICTQWKKVTGDAGWAGVLAEAFLKDPQRMAFLICPVGLDPLPLIAEAIALLPQPRRWEATFSTYFTSAPQNVNCVWRCLYDGTPEVHQSKRYVQALRLNLIAPLAPATGGALVDLARTGRLPTPAAAPRPGTRDAAAAALDALPPPPGGGEGAYRLQPTRAAAQPPLLETSPRLRRPKGKGAIIAWVVAGMVLLAAVGAGVVMLQRTDGTKGVVVTQSGIASPAATPTTPPASTAPIPTSKPPSTESKSESEPVGADSDSATAEPAANPAADSVESPEPSNSVATRGGDDASSPAPEQSQPQLQHVTLPQWTDDDPLTSGTLDISLPDVPIEDIQLQLLAPHNYKGLLRADEETSTLQNLNISHFNEVLSVPNAPIASIYVVERSIQSGSPQIALKWTSPTTYRRNILKWCVLAIRFTDKTEQRYLLHTRPTSETGASRALNSPHLLPHIDFSTSSEKDCPLPIFQYDPLSIQIGTVNVPFRDSPEGRSFTSLDRRFATTSLADFGIHFTAIEPALINPQDLPQIRSLCDLKDRTLAFEATSAETYVAGFIRQCKLRLEEAVQDHGVREITEIDRPNPELWFAPANQLQASQDRWGGVFKTVKEQFESQVKQSKENSAAKLEDLIVLNDIVSGCFEDAQQLLSLENNLKNAEIRSSRLFYEVTNEQGELFPIDVFRIDAPVPAERVTSGSDDRVRK